jgi:antitoxin HicB
MSANGTERERSYTILLDPDPEDGTYTVTVPALPGVVTQGGTVEEAIAMAKDAIALHIQGLVAHGDPVPEERQPPQILTIRVAA